MPASPQEILERLETAAAQRGLSGPTPAAYRRTWRDTVIRAAAAKLDPSALPQGRAEELYGVLRENGKNCTVSRHSTGKISRTSFAELRWRNRADAKISKNSEEIGWETIGSTPKGCLSAL